MPIDLLKGLYILEGKKPVPARSMDAWNQCMQSPERVVAQEDIGKIYISTVFLGLDHSFRFDDHESPVLFESMVFGGKFNGYLDRYYTWSEAERGHSKIVDMVRKAQFKIINGGSNGD